MLTTCSVTLSSQVHLIPGNTSLVRSTSLVIMTTLWKYLTAFFLGQTMILVHAEDARQVNPQDVLQMRVEQPGRAIMLLLENETVPILLEDFEAKARDSNGTVVKKPATRGPYPCTCADGKCSCCTGFILAQFNYNVRQKGCMNVVYDPDEFAFTMSLTMNDRVWYQNVVSGKNPRPMCIPVPRFPNIKMCVKLSNVYFAGRNVHLCVDMMAEFFGAKIFDVSFDCIRMGVDGVAVLKPEDGGGIPIPAGEVGVGDDDDDYDELEGVLEGDDDDDSVEDY